MLEVPWGLWLHSDYIQPSVRVRPVSFLECKNIPDRSTHCSMVDVTGYAAAIKCEDLVLRISINS